MNVGGGLCTYKRHPGKKVGWQEKAVRAKPHPVYSDVCHD